MLTPPNRPHREIQNHGQHSTTPTRSTTAGDDDNEEEHSIHTADMACWREEDVCDKVTMYVYVLTEIEIELGRYERC